MSTKFIHGNHEFKFIAKEKSNGRISVSMEWRYNGDEEDVKHNTFFFNAYLKNCLWEQSTGLAKSSSKASNKTGTKNKLEADFSAHYAVSEVCDEGIEGSSKLSGSKILRFRCNLEFGFRC